MLPSSAAPHQPGEDPHGTPMKRTTISALVATLFLSVVSGGYHPAGAEPHEAQVSLLRDKEFADKLLASIRNAHRSIVCSYYLFVVHKKNMSGQVVDELIRARRRGVDVRVILEKTRHKDRLNEENLHTAALLARGGVKVFFDSPDVVTHLKVTVIDGRYVIMGSHNLTQAALHHNNELSVVVDSPGLASEVLSYLNQL